MNKVVLTGNISSDVELKCTQQGTSITSFSLAVKRPRTKDDTTDFFTVVCWRSTAEFVSRYFKKGSGIEVSGCIITRKWTDKNGNNRVSVEIMAEEVDFGKNNSRDRGADNATSQSIQHIASEEFAEITDDNDLPF